MKQIVVSVPHDSFPADVGDRVRISLTGIDGFEMIEAYVNSIFVGCGSTDTVDLLYDETLLPSWMPRLTLCNIAGFQELCDCCSARPCMEVFAPTEVVGNVTRYVMTLPGPFRLDQIKFYTPTQTVDFVFHNNNIVDGFGTNVADEDGNFLVT